MLNFILITNLGGYYQCHKHIKLCQIVPPPCYKNFKYREKKKNWNFYDWQCKKGAMGTKESCDGAVDSRDQ